MNFNDFSGMFNMQPPATHQKTQFIKTHDNAWMFEFAPAYYGLFDQLCELQEKNLSHAKLAKEFSKIIDKMPEVFDAHSGLAALYQTDKKNIEACAIYEKAIRLARSYISKKFVLGKHIIPWICFENRPFLRLLCDYAVFIEHNEGAQQALPLYEELLLLNPNDNQGTREIVATIYLQLNQPEKVIILASQYPEDTMPGLVVGNILALYQIGNIKQAKKLIKENTEYQTHIFEEILKNTHSKPKMHDDGYITVGGQDQAWEYWESQGIFWKNTTGAQEFLKECLKK